MLLSAIPRSSSNSLLLRNHTLTSTSSPTANNLLSTPTTLKPLLRAPTAPPASSLTTSSGNLENPIHHVTHSLSDGDDEEAGGGSELVSSASAVASAIRKGSGSPVKFVQKMEQGHNSSNNKTKLVLPSPDFQRLCVQQLDLFRRIVDPDAILSVYVRPAGSYVMDRLELRRVTSYPGVNASSSDIVILVANFNIPTGLRAAEAALSSKQAECVADHRAVVFPMVKHPFVVGFLVAELPMVEMDISCANGESDLISPEEAYASSSASFKKPKSWSIQTLNDEPSRIFNFTAEQRLNAIDISHTLAMAYVMDQKALLLQQSSWQNNVRMTTLVEQIRGPLSSIRTLSKMLSIHTKRSEIAYDIVEDIMVQGDSMRDALQELQDAVYLTKANIVRYNEETLKKIHNSAYAHPEPMRSQLPEDFLNDSSNKFQTSGKPRFLNPASKDMEMPMPPLALSPLQQHGIRPCNVSEVLSDLVEAAIPLANKQQRSLELSELSQSLQVAIEESALRQALSNLIEGALLRTHVGGKVEIVSTGAPAGGALVVIDDDGPDMHYMTQMRSLIPFGAELFSENMVEDNMTWNFVAGLTVAREILENYGCVVRVISPRISDAALGTGGTRIELWLPSFAASSDQSGLTHDA
ncbi:CHLOROPLAST SENSOR KINASE CHLOROPLASTIC [Salix purpurea]|uniref:CHLOROPLAST SENSOR KINASE CHLOROPLASTIC n=1 Tax=Salix purpurea TaxID=77065 RepID=A0A9Q0TXJ8_SALPP|nr:CHLOROPLAST SENSOR KINASE CHLOROPLASTIC [Salix purpurea]